MDAKLKSHGSAMDQLKTSRWVGLLSLCIIHIRYDNCSIFYAGYLTQLNGSFDLVFAKNKYPRCIYRGEPIFEDIMII